MVDDDTFIANQIMNHTNVASQDHDLYIGAMFGIKLWLDDPSVAFCNLNNELKRLGGLDRAATSLLTILALRMDLESNNSCYAY